MKVLFCSSEAYPFARTGGLSDVASALPKALTAMGHDVRIIMPMYSTISEEMRQTFKPLGATYVQLGWRNQYLGLYQTTFDNVTYYFVDNMYYFDRNKMYGHFDDGERFAYFSKAILESLQLIDFYPDVIHANDWQTALVPVFLDAFYRQKAYYDNIKTVLTIHNIKFQGQFDPMIIGDILGLSGEFTDIVSYGGCCNYLKGGIERANMVTTVSRTYAEEITYPYYAFGLEDILRERAYKIKGVVNGIDTEFYNPATDKALFKGFNKRTVLSGKRANKQGLCEMLNLPYNENRPLIAMVTRLTDQKGLDIVADRLEEILAADVGLVILGQGDWKYETLFSEMAKIYPSKLSAVINFSSDIASKIYAAADLFLMPSQFEPCGLSQMVAMRYGAIPIVRETGGLKDTVEAVNPVKGTGVGFTFKTFNSYDMLDAILRALGAYYDKKLWKQIQKNAMDIDFSWGVSAKEYLSIYQQIL